MIKRMSKSSRRPAALLIPSPWSGDENDPIPRSYRAWFRAYVVTRRLRHLVGLHDWIGFTHHRCSWCGKARAK